MLLHSAAAHHFEIELRNRKGIAKIVAEGIPFEKAKTTPERIKDNHEAKGETQFRLISTYI